MRAAFLAPLMLLALAACGKPAPAPSPAKPAVTTVQTGGEGGQVTVTGSDGQATTIKAGAPAVAAQAADAAAPGYAPVYPGAAILSRVDTKVPGGDVTMLKFTTKDTPDQVMTFYRDAARKAGVPVSADLDMGGEKMFAAEEEGGARGMQLTTAAAGGLTVVQLTYHAPKT